MLFLIQQLCSIMLAMDIQKFGADLTKLCYRDRATIGSTYIFAVAGHFTLQQKVTVLIRNNTVSDQSQQILRHSRKGRTDKSLVGSRANQLTRGSSAKNGAHGINYDGLAGTRLTGQCVETRVELNIRLFNHRNIFNVQQIQHMSPSFVETKSPDLQIQQNRGFPGLA